MHVSGKDIILTLYLLSFEWDLCWHVNIVIPDLFTERKAAKKLKKLPKLSDAAVDKVEAAAHKDAEAVHILNDDYSGIVGVVIGTVIGVSLIIALVSWMKYQQDIA